MHIEIALFEIYRYIGGLKMDHKYDIEPYYEYDEYDDVDDEYDDVDGRYNSIDNEYSHDDDLMDVNDEDSMYEFDNKEYSPKYNKYSVDSLDPYSVDDQYNYIETFGPEDAIGF